MPGPSSYHREDGFNETDKEHSKLRGDLATGKDLTDIKRKVYGKGGSSAVEFTTELRRNSKKLSPREGMSIANKMDEVRRKVKKYKRK